MYAVATDAQALAQSAVTAHHTGTIDKPARVTGRSRSPRLHVLGQLRVPDREAVQLQCAAHRGRDSAVASPRDAPSGALLTTSTGRDQWKYLGCDVAGDKTSYAVDLNNHLTHMDVDTSVFGGTRPRMPGRHVHLGSTTEKRWHKCQDTTLSAGPGATVQSWSSRSGRG